MTSTRKAPGAVGAAAEGGNQKPAEGSVAPIIADRSVEHEVEGDNQKPCRRFDWCDGHRASEVTDDLSAHYARIIELDGAFGVLIVSAEYVEDDGRGIAFSVHPFGEWLMTVDAADAEISEYAILLLEARQRIRAFVSEHPELTS